MYIAKTGWINDNPNPCANLNASNELNVDLNFFAIWIDLFDEGSIKLVFNCRFSLTKNITINAEMKANRVPT